MKYNRKTHRRQRPTFARTQTLSVFACAVVCLIGCQIITADETAPKPAVAPPPPAPIYKSAKPIKVDGELNDPAWAAAAPIEVNYLFNETDKRDTRVPMIVRFAWDDNYFYIAYEIFDTDLVAVDDGRIKGPPDNQRKAAKPWAPEEKVDIAEFMFHVGDDMYLWELHHNSLNHFNEAFLTLFGSDSDLYDTAFNALGYMYQDEITFKDRGDIKFKSAVHMMTDADGNPATPNDASDVDTGYTGEIRIPRFWVPTERITADDGSRSPSRQMRILSVCLNGNDGYEYHHSSAQRPGAGMFANGVKLFPRYVLLDQTAARADSRREH